MLLKDFIPHVHTKYRNIFFSGISFHSNKIRKNNIFFAIKGTTVDGNDYINEAIKNGAKLIISETKITKKKRIYCICILRI